MLLSITFNSLLSAVQGVSWISDTIDDVVAMI